MDAIDQHVLLNKMLTARLYSPYLLTEKVMILMLVFIPMGFVVLFSFDNSFGITWFSVLFLILIITCIWQYWQYQKDKKRLLFIATKPLPDETIAHLGELDHTQKARLQMACCELVGLWVFVPIKEWGVTVPSRHVYQIFQNIMTNHHDYGTCIFGHQKPKFYKYYHDKPREIMGNWILACKFNGINPKEPGRLPNLFMIDALIDNDLSHVGFDELRQVNTPWHQEIWDVIEICQDFDSGFGGDGSGGFDGGDGGGGGGGD